MARKGGACWAELKPCHKEKQLPPGQGWHVSQILQHLTTCLLSLLPHSRRLLLLLLLLLLRHPFF